jgi:hypothetical protein
MRSVPIILLMLALIPAGVCIYLPVRGASTFFTEFRVPYSVSEHASMIVKQSIGPALTIFTCLALIFLMRIRRRWSYWLFPLLPIGPLYIISHSSVCSHEFSHTVFEECSSFYGTVIESLSALCGLLMLLAFVVRVYTGANQYGQSGGGDPAALRESPEPSGVMAMDIPPKIPPSPAELKRRPRWSFGCMGASAGGCLIPMVLFFLAAAGGDTGGPLVWPFIGIPLAVVGCAVGLCFYDFRKDRKNGED